MAPPLIALSAYREPARWGVWDQRADLLPASYSDMVVAAGGLAVLVPPADPYAASAAALLARVDGLLVTGGADVDPAAYGQAPPPRRSRCLGAGSAGRRGADRAADAGGVPGDAADGGAGRG